MSLEGSKRSPEVVTRTNLRSFKPDLSQVLESSSSPAPSTIINLDDPTVKAAEAAPHSPTMNKAPKSPASPTIITHPPRSWSVSTLPTSSEEEVPSAQINLWLRNITQSSQGEGLGDLKRKRESEESQRSTRARNDDEPGQSLSERLDGPEIKDYDS
ncbi:uncharacterized protein MELLADRAFT_61063 [Melampsora larici-populina 98AG31]|uniref:Uncharacterized protein n=1 Tax=Melampsora larici-populina (strain 98AG31 / pathotype 3-4-7) TaxID=747676 RepID=F4RDG2_MELLP|nr:uncharacterized protein MELLADRAFT_61063 [Melampsora larici-populina 98AG31]EGG09397.1 hypothetical protein MELLADRAFT_61063 [Melampsora larici-populina 98AG31]